MTQKDLVKNIVKKTGLSNKEAKMALESVVETIKESLLKKEPVKIHNFGVFKIVKRKARKSKLHNKIYDIPARYAPEVSFSSHLKNKIHKLS